MSAGWRFIFIESAVENYLTFELEHTNLSVGIEELVALSHFNK